MSIAILGTGAIGNYVRANTGGKITTILTRPERVSELQVETGLTCVGSAKDLPEGTNLLIDCSGHVGLAEHGPTALARGIDVLTVSVGALADEDIAKSLTEAAAKGGGALLLASGAIGALDALRGARVGELQSVTYTGRKPPAGWRGSPAEEVVDLSKPLGTAVAHFTGSARQAALQYPKNANVAAAVALAGIGLDDTTVALIADPDAKGNTHEITAQGAFGELTFTITGKGMPENPRSSALAAMSVVAAVRERSATIRFA